MSRLQRAHDAWEVESIEATRRTYAHRISRDLAQLIVAARIAVVALARRLAGILYAMWRDGRAYDASRTFRARPEVTTAA